MATKIKGSEWTIHSISKKRNAGPFYIFRNDCGKMLQGYLTLKGAKGGLAALESFQWPDFMRSEAS